MRREERRWAKSRICAGAALSPQGAGVPHHDALAMKEPAAHEGADDSAMTDLRRQIASIDDELARDCGDGVVGKARRVVRWPRK
jgi:hypothetical protein